MSFLKRLFGLEPAKTQKVQAAPVCPFVVGGTTTLERNTVDYEFAEIKKTEWGWQTSGIATVNLPAGAKNVEIKEIVSGKYGSVEGYNVHFELDGHKRIIHFNSEYRIGTEMKNKNGYPLSVHLDIKEIRT